MRILLFDDNVADRTLTRALLGEGERAVHVREVSGAIDFAELLGHRSWDVAIGERTVDWADGLDLLMTLKRRHPRCATVLFTAQAPDELGMLGHRAAVDAYVRKDSAGYLKLPELITDAARRAQGSADGVESENGVKGSIDTLPLGYFWALSDGTILRANPTASALLNAHAHSREPVASLLDAFTDLGERARCAKALHLGERLPPTAVRIGGVACHFSVWPVPDVGGRSCVEGLVWEVASSEAVAPTSGSAWVSRAPESIASIPSTPTRDDAPAGLGLEPTRRPASSDLGSVTALRPPAWAEGTTMAPPEPGSPIPAHAQPPPAEASSHTPDPARRRVDLTETMRAVTRRLRETLRARGARVACGPLPCVHIDPGHAERLLRESIEYLLELDRDPSPRFAVRADPQATGWLLSVRRPRAHLDPDAHQRLVSSDVLSQESEHALAIGRRIAKRYGGDLWLTTSGSEGTTILVNLHVETAPLPALSVHLDGESLGQVRLPADASKQRIARAALALPGARQRMGKRRVSDIRLAAGGTVHLIAR